MGHKELIAGVIERDRSCDIVMRNAGKPMDV